MPARGPFRWRAVTATALRGLRGARGRLAFAVLVVTAGVAAQVSVDAFADLAGRSVRAEARRLLAADVEVSAHRPLTAAERAAIARVLPPGAAVTDVVELVTMAVAPAPGPSGTPPRARLVELRAIGPGYPFYGALVTEPREAAGRTGTHRAAVVHPELLGQLGLAPGDALLLGRARFEIAGVIRDEPDRSVAAFSAGPRVVIGLGRLDPTGLAGPGSHTTYRMLVRLPGDPAGAPALAHRLAASLDDPALRVASFEDAQPRLRRFFTRLTDYLGLLSLTAVAVAGIGVGSQIAVHVGRQLDAVAVLRCLGATGGEIAGVFALQAALLGLAGGLAGALLGTAAQAALPHLLAGLLPVEVPLGVSAGAAARGVATGVAVALLAAWLPLRRLRRIPALRVLRRGLEADPRRFDAGHAAALLVPLAALLAAAALEGGSIRTGALFVAGLGGAIAGLWGAAAAAIAGLRAFRGRLGFAARHGIASLRRPGNQTAAALVAMGTGVSLLVALVLVRGAFDGEVASARGASRPSLFLVDIQPDQAAGISQLVAAAGGKAHEAPLVQARLRAINGRPAAPRRARYAGDRGEDADWTRTREYRLSYTAALPEGNEIVAGRWWGAAAAGADAAGRDRRGSHDTGVTGSSRPPRAGAASLEAPGSRRPPGASVAEWPTGAMGASTDMPAADRAPASMEAGFAKRLGVGLGDRLEFDVQGVRLTVEITSLRRVRWETMTPNFFVLLPPGWLEGAPQLRIAAVELPPRADRAAFQDRLVAAFPNVTVIDLSRLVAKVVAVLDRIGFAVRFMALFCLAAGVVVLIGAIAGTAQERAREASILKVLGADRRRVAGVLVVELAALGALAGTAGAAAAAGLAWVVLELILELPWPWHLGPWPFAVGMAVTLAATVAVGLVSALPVLGRRPLDLLREA